MHKCTQTQTHTQNHARTHTHTHTHITSRSGGGRRRSTAYAGGVMPLLPPLIEPEEINRSRFQPSRAAHDHGAHAKG